MEDALVILAMSSVGLLWAFSFAGAMQLLWDAFGEHFESVLARLKR